MSQATSESAVFLGVNLLSDRVNVLAVTDRGTVLTESSAPFERKTSKSSAKNNLLEEDPEIWWDATRMALGYIVGQLQKITSPAQLRAISVSGDPGTLVVVNHLGNPAMPAILAEDTRAYDYVRSLNLYGRDHCAKLGFQFRTEDTLAKIAWLKDSNPKLYEESRFVHQADFIVGRLKGLPDVTEFSFAERTGCDLLDGCWPDWLDYDMYLSVRDRLPLLMHLGEKVGTISAKASAATGLPTGMSIVMGTTSVTAAFLASGARREGDLHTILGQHITISGISATMIRSPQDQIRVSRLPGQKWTFSVNSQTGTEWLRAWFPGVSFDELESAASENLPCDFLAYPNVSKEESFPFVSGSAVGFIYPATEDRALQFAASLQGTALFEQLCYQKLNRLAGTQDESPGDIYTGGEYSTSDAWMQCRADVTGRINRRMKGQSSAAFGTAMIAALGSEFHSLEAVADAMLAVDSTFYPNPEKHAQYAELFSRFCYTMEEQGYGSGLNRK
ncbi:MAG: FGGY-family carbohydrate kinase [Planctomycetaceae bacterium]|jgi:xylulokinase|nr:FGGY-family carbohydrate kinase [Planctomycetaceae bacterium]